MTTSSPDDLVQAMLAQAATGDASAWRSLVEAYAPRVHGLIFQQCRDHDLAEEMTQACFVKVVTSLADYQETGRFEAWLFRIAMNHLRDEMRRRKRQATPMGGLFSEGDDDGAATDHTAAMHGKLRARGGQSDRYVSGEQDPGEKVSRSEQHDLLRELLATLKPEDQEVLHLRHTAGLTFAQIAETLGQPLGTVLARSHRALAKLRERMAEREMAE